MHLLDTDSATLLFENHPRVVQRMRELPEGEVAVTIVTKAEILRGRVEFLLKAADQRQMSKAQRLLALAEEFLASMRIVPLDDSAWMHFERLRQTKGLRKIGQADRLNASIALAGQATLVTRNRRDFRRIPNLKVVNWAD